MQRSDWQKILDLFCSSDSNDWELGFLLLRSALEDSSNKDALFSLLLGMLLFQIQKDETSKTFNQKLRRFLAKKDAYFFRKFSVLQHKVLSINNKHADNPVIQYQKMMDLLNFGRFQLDVLSPIFNAQLSSVASRQLPLIQWQLTYLLVNNQLTTTTIDHCLINSIHLNFKNIKTPLHIYLHLHFYIPQVTTQLATLIQQHDHITFNRNNLSELPAALYENKKLQVLSISSNPIKSLGNNLANWTMLQKLEVYFCRKLQHFPTSMIQLTELTKLSIKHCRLTAIPEVFFQLTELRILELSQNKIKHIPDQFERLKNLNFLNLNQNIELYELPASIYQLTELECLWVKDCGLNKLDKRITQLTKLQDLRLSQNGIKFLPKNFTALKNLKILHLERTQIRCDESFWETILAMPKLEHLELLGVRIRGDIYTKYKIALAKKLTAFKINDYYLY